MKKLKISIICLILISIIMLLQQPVKATESFQTQLTTNKQEIKKGEEIEIILTFKNFEDINKGINSYKATLDYNENVFEEVNVSNFESLNLWEEFLYNSKNHEFISIKKAGCNTEEDVLKFKLKAKENVNPEDTIIKVKDVVASEGKKDIKINDTQISISVIKEQDNSNPENPGNFDNSNNGQSGEEDKIPSGNLPNTGLTIKSSFILILIEILVIIAIVVLIKMKKIDKKINKNGKMLLMFLTTGIVTIQFVGTIYAFSQKGELNEDGQINYKDVSLLEQHLISLNLLPQDKLENADINSDKKITVTDLTLLVQKIEKTLDYSINITTNMDNYYPNKNEEIDLKFSAIVSYDAKIEEVTINGQNYKVENEPNTTNYIAKVKAQSNSGIQEFKITKVKLNVGKEEKVNHTIKVDVLKEKPYIDNYEVIEVTNEAKLKLCFDIIDNDKSITNARIELLEKLDSENNKFVKEENINIGKNEIVLDLEENKEYIANIYLNYNLDTDQLAENEKDNTGEIVESKDLKLAIDYKFTFNNLKTYNEQNVESNKFSKNEPIIIGFESTNATKFIPKQIKINDKVYEVTTVENNRYMIKLDAINQVGEHEIKISEIILENGKKFILNENNIIKVKIQKEKPTVKDVNIEEQDDGISISFNIQDTDNTISNKKLLIKNSDNKIIFQKELISNSFNEKCQIPDELTQEYKIEIIADYDITIDNTENQQNQILYTQTIKAKPRAKIEKAVLSKTELEKDENLTITYKINKNKNEEISKLIVNNIEVTPKINKDNTYSITIPVGNIAGKQKVILSKVIFSDGIEAKVNYVSDIEVLKSNPNVINYHAEDDYNNVKVKFEFELVDEDNSLVNGKVQLVKKDGTVQSYKEFTQKGKLYFELPVVEKEEYNFQILATFAKNEDKTQIVNEQVLLEKPVQMITDYELKISEIKTLKEESSVETKYFNRDEKIKLIFTSTNSTKFVPEKAQINGKQYTLTKLANSQYQAIIDEIPSVGLAEIKIEKLWMNNSKELDVENNNITNIEILKLAPTVTGFEYEELANNQIKVIFDIIDSENSMSDAKIVISDKNSKIYEKDGLVKGKNEIIFNTTLSEEYTVKILANYDLDNNSFGNGQNEYVMQEIEKQIIQILQELIELKDIKSVQVYTKNGDKIEDVSEIDTNNFEPKNYIAKVTMKELPTFYAEIKEGKIENNDFILVLKYDNVVYYDGDAKTNNIQVKFGEIDNGFAKNIDFNELIRKVQQNPTAEITLTNDIDAKTVTSSGATYLGDFKGTIKGNGHIIKNLTKPLFNKLESAKIENLIIEDSKLSGSSRGILANHAVGTTISNVHIKDSSIETWHSNGTGAFVGTGENRTVIEKCSLNNIKVSSYKIVGGFAGYYMSDSIINNSYIKGTVSAGYDAIGGIIGQTSGRVTLQNSYADIDFNMTVDWAVGGLVGYSAGDNVIMTNNISLARGTKGKRVIGTGYNNQSSNNYEIEESKLLTNSDNKRIKTISKTIINEDFLKDILKWDDTIWRMENASGEIMPTLKNLDPEDMSNKEEVIEPENSNVYIPDIARLRKMTNYNTKKEIAYHNMNLLMPFYDAKLFVEYGNKINEDNILNQSKIKLIIPYDKNNNYLVGINTNNYNKIVKIKVVFENNQVQEYTLEFKTKLSDVATYKIKELDIGYTYNKFILNAELPLVREIISQAKNLDYKTQIQKVTPEEESRLYVDYYNDSVKNKIDEVMLYILSNEPEYNLYLNNEILLQKIKQEILANSQLEKILYTYNYFDKWYNIKIGGCSLSDVIFLNINNTNKDQTIKDLINATISQGQNIRQTSNTVGFYNNVLKSKFGNKDIGGFLEYFMNILAGYNDGNKWFEDNFKGILNQKPAVGKEDTIRYKAWDLMKARNHLILPILTAPQNDMYIISVPSQIVIGSMNRYGQHIEGNTSAMEKMINDYATMIGNFYGVSATFIKDSEKILNTHAHIQYDTRFNFPQSGDQHPGTTQDPVIKWVYEAIGAIASQNGSGAYANGTDVYWVVYHALGSDFSFSVFSHETAHNQDGYYFYEGYGRRWNTWAEDHADSNIAQDLGDGSFVFNIRRDSSVTSDDSNNIKLERIIGSDKIYSYYKEMFETYYVLDYLTGQAFLQLTPEQQSKVAVQVSYENGANYEQGGQNTIYSKISADQFSKMNLKDMEDLWDNGIALRNAGKVSGNGPGSYGGDNHYSIYWYQPHNNFGRPDSYSFKRLGFEMLGVGGYSNGYVIYRSGKSSNDLDALRKITQDNTMTWKKYKMNRFKNVEQNLNNIPYFDSQEVIQLFKQSLEKDAANGNRNNTNSLRRTLYGVVKRSTKDFETGTIYSSGEEIEISSAQQFVEILNSAEWGNYKLTKDLDFSNIKTTDNTYINKAFVGRINGNGFKIKGLTKTLFNEMAYGEIQDLTIEEPVYDSQVTSILSKTSKNIVLNNVVTNNSNLNLPFIKNNNGLIQWLGTTAINIKDNEIKTVQDFIEISNSEDSSKKKMNYVLSNDIDLSSISNVNSIINGTFEGKINGNGYTLSNLKAPLFNKLTGIVENLNIENVTIKKSGTANLAAIAGTTQNATLNNIKINNVEIEGWDNISAVVGLANATTFNKISATNIDIKASHYYAGGVIGRSYNSVMKDIFVSGILKVKDTHNGGVIGAMNKDTLQNIYADVDVVRYSNGDGRNKNAGLYGAIETEGISIKNAIVVGNMSESLYKITPATNDTEKNQITKYLVNVFEYENSTGISNAETGNIKKASQDNLQDENFYINELNFSTDIWDFSELKNGNGPKLK